jgi:hypothetical protein
MTDPRFINWRKSTRSGNEGTCVEIAENVPTVVGIRDSKDPAGPVLVPGRRAFAAFIGAVKDGALS